MDDINIYISDLVEQGKLSYAESQIFVDFAHDLVLNGYSDLEIEDIVKKDINQHIKQS